MDADPIRALAWLMQSAARDQDQAVVERDALYAALDDSGRVRAESLSRDLGVPMPAGWLRDPDSAVAVWAPSWYRNGTWGVRIEVQAVDGLAEGEGKVSLEARLYGRSSRTHAGRFRRGLMVDEAAAGQEPRLLQTDEVRFDVAIEQELEDRISALWLQNALDGLAIPACPKHNPLLFAVVRETFPVIVDAAVQQLGLDVMAVLNRRCALDPRGDATLVLLAPGHEPVIERGDTRYAPRLAEVQLYGDGAAPQSWRANVRANPARRAHEQALREQARATAAQGRKARRQRERIAAGKRGNPMVRGVSLGLSLAQFHDALGDSARDWSPAWSPAREPSPHAQHRQAVTLDDAATLKATFASSQHEGRLLVLVYEQRLRSGPPLVELREQLFRRYGKPDRESGRGTWLTWWLNSVTGAPTGAFLKARLQTDPRSGQVELLRLVLNDAALARQDESRAADARRAAERARYERSKSGEVKF